MFRILILLILILYCTHKKTFPLFYLSDENPLGLSFVYGEKPSGKELAYKPWGAMYSIQEGKLCLSSADPFYTETEYGPRFHFCFDKEEETYTVLKGALDNLYSQQDFHNISWISHIQGEPIKLSFLKVGEVNKAIKEEPMVSYSLGDSLISTASLSEDVNGIHFVKNYSAIYFSILNFESRSLLLLPSVYTSPSQRKYLAIEFSKAAKLHIYLRDFVNQVKLKNEQFKNECKHRSLTLTEFLFSEHPKGKFFIEFTNDSDEIVCLPKLEMGSDTYTETIEPKTSFLFPKQSILLTSKGSHLEGLVLSDQFWKEVRREKKLTYTTGIDKGEYDFTSLSFSFSSLYFSHTQAGISSCQYKKIKLYNWTDMCGDPGIERSLTTVEVEACNTTDFLLTEFNPFGIRSDTSTDYHDKFIELVYRGEKICSLYDLKLVISNMTIPLDVRMVIPSQTLVVGLGRNYKVESLIERSLYGLTLDSFVSLESSLASKILWSSPEQNFYVFQLDSRKRLHSILPQATYIELHPAYLSSHLSDETKKHNHVSPGEWIEPSNQLSFEWNEISWMGSYHGDTSLADDEFLELKTSGTGSLEIHVIESQNVKKYLVPISIEDNFTVISRKNLACFSFPYTVQNSNWNLPNASSEIKIFYRGVYHKNFLYSTEDGINDSSSKKRASFSYTGYSGLWKNSGALVSNGYALCENTDASPGRDNHFSPDIIIDIPAQNQANIQVIQSVYDTSLNINLLLYSVEPSVKKNYNLSTKEMNVLNLDTFYPYSLVYAKIHNQEDLFLINRSGISIDSVHPGSSTNSSLDWFRFCNYGSYSFDLQYLQVHDSYSGGGITKLENRNFPLWEILQTQYSFKNGYSLEPNECAFVIDPKIQTNFLLNVEGDKQFLLFTPITQNSIGNGISQTDSIDIYLPMDGINTHLASFQNIHSHLPFVITTSSGQLTLLKENKQGTRTSDYRSIPWD
jgi:hypothetical protein